MEEGAPIFTSIHAPTLLFKVGGDEAPPSSVRIAPRRYACIALAMLSYHA